MMFWGPDHSRNHKTRGLGIRMIDQSQPPDRRKERIEARLAYGLYAVEVVL
jgi:hypothetical protein